MRALLSTVELRHTNGRSAAYHVDLFQNGQEYVVSIRYGTIGKGTTRKDESPVSTYASAAVLYDQKVAAKTKKGYELFAGNLSVPRPAPAKHAPTKPLAVAITRAAVLSHAFQRVTAQPAAPCGTPPSGFVEEVVYDDF